MNFASIFSNEAVLQQNKTLIIRGFGAKSTVTVSLSDKIIEEKYICEPKNQKFSFSLPAHKGSNKSYILKASDGKEECSVTIKFGDVFLFAGQSNMSFPLSATEKHEIYADKSEKAEIYFLNIGEAYYDAKTGIINRPSSPLEDIDKKFIWKKANHDEVMNSSALSVMFAVMQEKDSGLPIGIINTSLGGVSVDSYISQAVVESDCNIKDYLIKTDKYIDNLEKYNSFEGANYTQTSGIFNEKIYPLLGSSVKAIFWYQGENSANTFESAVYYYHALKGVITTLRNFYCNPLLPIFVTEIAQEFYPYGDTYGYNYINEAIIKSQDKNTYFIPIRDVEARWKINDGEKYYHPIHTVNKEEVAKRYFKFFKKNIISNEGLHAPEITSVEYKNGYAECKVSYSIPKPKKSELPLIGFTIAGKDGLYYPANAEVTSKGKILVFSDYVKAPKHITYAFNQYNYYCPLSCSNGLPLSQFRSDYEAVCTEKYYFDNFIFSCDKLFITENNFGYEVGGGLKKRLWSKGDIFNSQKRLKLSLDNINKTEGKYSLKAEFRTSNDVYFYFGIKAETNIAGISNCLPNYKYLYLDIASSNEVEFHGIVFRYRNKICKLRPKQNTPLKFIPLKKEFKTYCVDLTEVSLGDESFFPITEIIKKQIAPFELYFRSYKDCTVRIDNLRLNNVEPTEKNIEPQKLITTDLRMKLPE